MPTRNLVRHHGEVRRQLNAAVPMALVRDTDLSAMAKAVALEVWSHTEGRHQSARSVSQALGIDRKTAASAIAELQDRRWMIREVHYKTGPNGNQVWDREVWHLQMTNTPLTEDQVLVLSGTTSGPPRGHPWPPQGPGGGPPRGHIEVHGEVHREVHEKCTSTSSAVGVVHLVDHPEIPLGSAAVTDTTIDTDPLGVGSLGAVDEPRQGSALGGHEMSALECGTNQSTAEGNQPVNYDPFDPFGSSQAAEADFGSWPPVSSESLTADQEFELIETGPVPAISDPLGIDSAKSEPIRWPSGKPQPKPGDPDWLSYDPFGVYVDATTGEPLAWG